MTAALVMLAAVQAGRRRSDAPEPQPESPALAPLPTILLSPYPRPMRNDKRNPKEYPWWPELIALLPGRVVQLAVDGEKALAPIVHKGDLDAVREDLKGCDLWLACDNFLQHMAHQLPKPGVVLWGKSDPNIFGYPENLNLLVSRKNLRARQFDIWEPEPYEADVFVRPAEVLARIARRWPTLLPGEGSTIADRGGMVAKVAGILQRTIEAATSIAEEADAPKAEVPAP